MGHITATLSARLPPHHAPFVGVVRQWASYLVNPAPVPLLATAMMSSVTREEQEEAVAEQVAWWLTKEAKPPLPKAMVQKVGHWGYRVGRRPLQFVGGPI